MSTRRADRELRARRHQRRQRRLQHREARLDERAVHCAGCRSRISLPPRGRCSTTAGLGSHPLVAESRAFHRLLELLRPRAKRLTDFVEQARPLLTDAVEYEPEAVEKHLSSPDLAGHIDGARGRARARRRRSTRRRWKRPLRGTASARGDQGRRADSRHARGGDRSHTKPGTVRNSGLARAGSRPRATRAIAGISRRPRPIGAGWLCGRRAVRYNWRFLPSPRPRPYWEVVQR